MNSIKVCEYSRSRSFHDDLKLQDQASGERSQDQWSSGYSSRMIISVVDFHYRVTVINMKDTPVFIGQMHSFHSYV